MKWMIIDMAHDFSAPWVSHDQARLIRHDVRFKMSWDRKGKAVAIIAIFGPFVVGAKIFACRNGRLLHEAVRHSLPEAVIEDHVLESLGARAD